MIRPAFALPLAALLVGCMQQHATGPAIGIDADHSLVYFDEMSANLLPDAQQTIADAAKRARETSIRSIRVEGRASATGSFEANKRLAETRTQIVADELVKDGVPARMVRQLPIGQTESNDPTVNERRVDIILER